MFHKNALFKYFSNFKTQNFCYIIIPNFKFHWTNKIPKLKKETFLSICILQNWWLVLNHNLKNQIYFITLVLKKIIHSKPRFKGKVFVIETSCWNISNEHFDTQEQLRDLFTPPLESVGTLSGPSTDKFVYI